MPLDGDDAFIAKALAPVAERARPQASDRTFLEKRLAEAVAESLADGPFRRNAVVRDKKLANCTLPGWDPQPGTIDVAVVTPDNEPRFVFELKIDDVEWTLWDIYKMVAASELPTVEAAYLVVAGTTKLWGGTRECVELFDLNYAPGDGEVDQVEWYSRFLFARYRKSWKDLLGGGSGRLTRVPKTIWITGIGSWPLSNLPGYEMRVIRVSASHRHDEWLDFSGDWPVPPPPPPEPRYPGEPQSVATSAMTIADLPAPDAEEGTYHRFALTFNGYEEMGSLKRCGRIANESIERWRDSRELPTTIDELRACMFFEQRRWHHFGYGFDEETMAYLKEIVAKLKDLLQAGGRTPTHRIAIPPA